MPFSNVSPTLFTAAEAYFTLGYSVIPLHGDADLSRPKVAAVPWAAYQQASPTLAQLHQWFMDDGFSALAIVTGAVSSLAVLDFDTPEGFRDFKSRFPALAATHVVQTRRGFHIYFKIPSNMRVPSRKGKGVDLLSDGCYVVARPSTIAGHIYKLLQGGQPRTLSLSDLHAILSFVEGQASHQSPVTSFQSFDCASTPLTLANGYRQATSNISPKTQHFELVPLYRYLAAKGEGRNRALFITSLVARDNGWPLERALQILVDVHITQHGRANHPSESPESRRVEAEKTIRSAYTRPARRPCSQKAALDEQGRPVGLPNTVRENLFRYKYTHAVRVWEGMNQRSIHPGTSFTAAQAVTLLKGTVGRDSIYTALNLVINGEALFECQSPSGHPQASNDAATNPQTPIPKKCFFGRAEKSGINPRGPKTRHFIMPAPLDWCRILGVEPTHSDPLTAEDLASAKQTRMAAHRELIKRRPGVYSRRWLARRLGVRVETIDTYNTEIPIHMCSQFIGKRIYWSNIRLVPDDMHIDGAFLEDSTGKRYPATRAIAAKLLAQGQSVTYKRQDANYYWYGECPPDLGVVYGQPARTEQPAPARSQYVNRLPKHDDHPAQSRGVQLDNHPAIGVQNTDFVGAQQVVPSENIPSKSHRVEEPPPREKPERLPSGRRRLKNANQEALACRVTEHVNRLSGDPALHIGIVVARRLVSQYDHALIDRTLALLESRRNIAKPAGFFITVLRSESKRKNWIAAGEI